MTKSTAIIFILIFSIIFNLEKPRKSIVVVVILISVGLFLFTFELTQFSLLGFSLVLSASCLSGIRWTLAQLVMQRSSLGLPNPIDMIYYIQPWMIMALFPLLCAVEGNHLIKILKSLFSDKFGVGECFRQFGLVFAGALLAFAMECSEYLLLSSTSSLTLSISGIFKEIITLTLAALINNDKLNPINITGLVMCLFGIIFHISIKAQKEARNQLRSQSTDSAESSPAKKEDVLRSLLRNSRTISESSYTFE
ncbi:DgyrCDS707 [Dimorphilus gyrociliatus]|uniref:DgyrCDS707 n=1 Tax=Dimorphilus gyrociliatus TaxID=2664684 RepID=A0A7I8V6Q1_9ANNE|nr:DgyrCDS707 [Dimorphilus gyrociliatus]